MKHLPARRFWITKALFPVLVFVALCLVIAEARAQDSAPVPAAQNTGDAPKIKFDELEHDFGKVEQNTSLKHSFTFKNLGKGLLVIENVKAS